MARARSAHRTGRRARLARVLLGGALSSLLVAGCGGGPAAQAALPGDLYRVGGETAHLQCQGTGSPTVVLLGGAGFSTTTWDSLRSELGPEVRSCAWDYPGVGHSTGAPMLTAAHAAAALAGTLDAAHLPRPYVLVGHSVAGLTTRLFVAEHAGDIAGVVLLDPTVPSFARTFDEAEFRPAWDGAASAAQVEQVTAWPDIPFEILRHDPAVYAKANVWSAAVEAQWGREQDAFAALAPGGSVHSVAGSGHDIHLDAAAATADAVRDVLDAAASTPRSRR